MSTQWIAASMGPSGTLYFDMVVNDCLVRDVWISEFTIKGRRTWQFVRAVHAGDQHNSKRFEVRCPMRDTFDEAKADAAMHFAELELEKH